MDEASKMFIKLSANKFQAMRVFIEGSETHESEISKMFLPTDNPLFFQLKVETTSRMFIYSFLFIEQWTSYHLSWYNHWNQNFAEEQAKEVLS